MNFIYQNVNYGKIICSPDAWQAMKIAKQNQVQDMMNFAEEIEKHIQQTRPEWNIERLLDYAGPKAICMIANIPEEHEDEWPWLVCTALKKMKEIE